MDEHQGIDTYTAPSGTGCRRCEETGGWWVHLRRCARCGNVGCCDSSPSQHATAHANEQHHPVITSFEPGENWFYDFQTRETFSGPEMSPPSHHPVDQPVPGPAGRVPANWRELIH